MNGSKPGPNERGDALVEVLVSMVIIAVAVAALMTALVTVMKSATQHRDSANANALIVSVAESLKNQAYIDCPDPVYSKVAGVTYPAGWTSATVTLTVRPWETTDWRTNSNCPPGGDQGLQKITVAVTSPDGQASQTLDVVKRK